MMHAGQNNRSVMETRGERDRVAWDAAPLAINPDVIAGIVVADDDPAPWAAVDALLAGRWHLVRDAWATTATWERICETTAPEDGEDWFSVDDNLPPGMVVLRRTR